MRIVFMGTPDFAVPSLRILVENGYDVVGVITAPDKPKGRGQKMMSTPVKEYAESAGLNILQPTNLKDTAFIEELKHLNVDLQVVVAFRMLPAIVWDMPPKGTINLHASLLPQFRGAAPINWAIIHGEKETGITTFFLQHEIDTGDIIFQEKEPIKPEDTAGTLYNRLMEKGGQLVLKTVKAIESENVEPFKQNWEGELKAAPKIFREDCEIDWNRPSQQVINFIRGMAPYPGAWTKVDGKVLKIFGVRLVEKAEKGEPGTYNTDNKTFLDFYTSDGAVRVTELQLEGKKKMDTEELLRGYNF
ncbi:MAG: methionyl-tRNA formyltransferase [Candidatus Cyclobacteriaceae bacterium M2_1C_046]